MLIFYFFNCEIFPNYFNGMHSIIKWQPQSLVLVQINKISFYSLATYYTQK
jgi:hypothetical protein